MTAAQAYKDGIDYPALNENSEVVKFLRKHLNSKFGAADFSPEDTAFKVIFKDTEFLKSSSSKKILADYLEKDPKSMTVLFAQAKQISMSETPETEKVALSGILTKAQELNKEASETRFIEGLSLYLDKKYLEAEKSFQTLIDIQSPYQADAQIWLTKAKEKLKNAFFDEA